jgi:hypothetical protein
MRNLQVDPSTVEGLAIMAPPRHKHGTVHGIRESSAAAWRSGVGRENASRPSSTWHTVCEQPNTFGIRTGVRITLTIREQLRATAIRFSPIAPTSMPVEGHPISQHRLLLDPTERLQWPCSSRRSSGPQPPPCSSQVPSPRAPGMLAAHPCSSHQGRACTQAGGGSPASWAAGPGRRPHPVPDGEPPHPAGV